MGHELEAIVDELEETPPQAANMTTVSESILFVEFQEATDCVLTLTNANTNIQSRNASLSRIREILDKYLDCPSLLDHHIGPMVQKLTDGALDHLRSMNTLADFSSSPLPHLLSTIYAMSKVRGRKRIQKFLPHDVDVLEIVLKGLQVLEEDVNDDVAVSSTTGPTEDAQSIHGPQLWESVYTLWNWMGILSLVPFDCSVVADATLVSTLIELATAHLSHPGPTREIAAACLASWLSRPDLEKTHLKHFVHWSKNVLDEFDSGGRRDVFRAMGALQTTVTILKVSTADRATLVDIVMPILWESTMRISERKSFDLLLRKLLIKWWTRLSCACLPPRVAPWRYQRGSRSLTENMRQATGKTRNGDDNNKKSSNSSDTIGGEDEVIFYVPDQVEDAMDQIISGLADSSTTVRWSSAKGIGRITDRLPAICAEDVLDAVLELFENIEKDHAWHGACLALAELARRGLMLPHRLKDVMPRISEAVHYDVPRHQTSVGAYVRDAACYAYWGIARAYEPSVLQPYTVGMGHSLVVASLFDREVNCRRAASAAFQEFVGRQGNFRHGIDILIFADYFSLGNRNETFTTIALNVAQFEEYRVPILSHLFKSKLCHWDPIIRVLASQSLGRLSLLDPSFVGDKVIPILLVDSLDPRDVKRRHGSLLGLAEIVLACKDLEKGHGNFDSLLSGSTLVSLADLVPTIEKKRLFRGKGGEQIRAAVCRFIECISSIRIPLTVPQQVALLDSIDACIPHPSETIQELAASALGALMRSYFPVTSKGPSDRLQKRVVDKYSKQVRTATNPAATRGFSLALGALPPKLLAPSSKVLDLSLACLCRASRPDATVGNGKDAETRRNSLIALSRICKSVGIRRNPDRVDGSSDVPAVCLSKKQVEHVFTAFFSGMGDYNKERRGDVGSWSRIVAMDGLENLSLQITKECGESGLSEFFDEPTCVRVIGGLLKQLSEKLDAVRSHAGQCLDRILRQSDPTIPFIPQKDRLRAALHVVDDRHGTNWGDASLTFPMVMQVASIDAYSEYVMSGVIISVGCLTESVAKHASKALLKWVKSAEGSARVEWLGDIFLRLFENHSREGRVILPLLKTIDLLEQHICVDHLIEDNKFSRKLISYLHEEEKNCKDVPRLFAIIDVALGMIRPCEAQQGGPLEFACSLLSHRFPRVRRYTAEHLYMRFLENPDLAGETRDGHPSLDLLLNNAWDGDHEEIKIREMATEVAEKLRVTILPSV